MSTLDRIIDRSDTTCKSFTTIIVQMTNGKYSGAIYPLYAFTVSEISLIIYAGCIPTLGPLYGYLRKSNALNDTYPQEDAYRESSKNTAAPKCYGIKLGSISSTEPERLASDINVVDV